MTQKLLILSEQVLRTLNLPQVVNIVDQLPHHPSKKWPKRDFNKLEGSTVHHFASEAPIVNQAKYHINVHGWPGIAYSIVIRDGQILQTNYLDDRTTHATGGNDTSIGVCIGGDLSKRPMTDFERRALTGVLIAMNDLKPNMWVKGHKEIVGSATSCPCTDMNRIRADLHAMEEELSFQVDTIALAADAYKLAVRVRDLLTKLKGTQWPKEAAIKLNRLKGVIEGTADVIANTILTLYKSASDEKFVGENADKLATIITEAKKEKLI